MHRSHAYVEATYASYRSPRRLVTCLRPRGLASPPLVHAHVEMLVRVGVIGSSELRRASPERLKVGDEKGEHQPETAYACKCGMPDKLYTEGGVQLFASR